ncbi:rhomboid family intramembrane serine protease [Paenibacillus sp. GCM10027627]|uniref:rhomboid family intramembrane serine protease n=1 Tax=unclassified Paenibacillus TaxID=185978 RepID=UPI0036453075
MFLRSESLKEYIRLYPVISVVLLINIGLFIAMEVAGSSTSNATLFEFGAMFKLEGYAGPEPWRFVSSMFLHIGFMHLLMNGFALYVFAAPLERMFGKWRFAVLYLASGIIGSIASYWLHPGDFIGAGASGAIYGIYAAYLYLSIFYKDVFGKDNAVAIQTILVVGVIYSIVMPNVDLYAHLGGFAGGLLATAVIFAVARRRRQ